MIYVGPTVFGKTTLVMNYKLKPKYRTDILQTVNGHISL